MAYNLLSCERDQSYLMPPSMRDWLSEGHLAWFIVDAVGQMDLREFYTVYRSDGWGAAAYTAGAWRLHPSSGANYTVRAILNTKVLDFVQLGGATS